MEPVTIALGGSTITLLGIVGKIVYNYGRDRKELNGTVERVKNIDRKLEEHIRTEDDDMRSLRSDITEIKTKVQLLIDHKIKDN